MKKTSVSKRTPRKIGQDDDENDQPGTAQTDSAITRPVFKSRKSSSLRTSFGPTTSDELDDDNGEQAAVVTPKRSVLSKIAIQRNASKRSSLIASRLPPRPSDDADDRPNYSPSSLQELKASTPSTPRPGAKDFDPDTELSEHGDRALDISAKFGSSLARYEQPFSIPTATEIAEKKARRARLALEAQEFISLDPDDPQLNGDEEDENVTRDERGNLILKSSTTDKWGLSEGRLARGDDEDVMEGFEEFTDDGRISLSRKAELEATARRKQELSEQIAAAEEARSEDEDSDDSERERITAFEAAQTRHGTYAEASESTTAQDQRPRTPPTISPLPTLEGVLARLRAQLAVMQAAQTRSLTEIETLRRQKLHLAEEEVRIQQALKDTAEKFATLRKEKGIPVVASSQKALDVGAHSSNSGFNSGAVTRLIGEHTTSDGPKQGIDLNERSDDGEENDTDDDDRGFVGLGFGGTRHGFGASGMLAMPLARPELGSDSDED